PLPAGSAVRLFDREQGSVVELPADAASWSHRVIARGAKPYRLALAIGSREYVSRAPVANAPARVELDPVAPNPTKGAQRLRFGLPKAADVRLEVFDATGRRVATPIDGAVYPAGWHSVLWPDAGVKVPSGIYFHRLT